MAPHDYRYRSRAQRKKKIIKKRSIVTALFYHTSRIRSTSRRYSWQQNHEKKKTRKKQQKKLLSTCFLDFERHTRLRCFGHGLWILCRSSSAYRFTANSFYTIRAAHREWQSHCYFVGLESGEADHPRDIHSIHTGRQRSALPRTLAWSQREARQRGRRVMRDDTARSGGGRQGRRSRHHRSVTFRRSTHDVG